jgi:hypothetical protein
VELEDLGDGLGVAWVVATRNCVGGYGGSFCEDVLRSADTCWRMGDNGANYTALLKRCPKESSVVFLKQLIPTLLCRRSSKTLPNLML